MPELVGVLNKINSMIHFVQISHVRDQLLIESVGGS